MKDVSEPIPTTADLSNPTIIRTAVAGPDRDGAARADAVLLVDQRRAAAARLAASLKMAEVTDAPDEADGAPVDEDAVFELRASAIGDIDEAGGRMVVTLDRVVLRDADGWERGAVAIADIRSVEVKRRFSATSIRIKGSESSIKLKGVRQTGTVGLRAAVAELRFPDDPKAPASTTAQVLHRLDEQAHLGLLTADELVARRAEVVRGAT